MRKIYGIGDEEELAEDLQKELSNRIIEELEQIKADFEEIQLLRDNPYNNRTEYSVSMTELRELFDNHISKLKGENKECPYFDYEVGTCRRSETEFDELNNLYYGMTDSMQKAVKDIMLVANGKEIEE